MLLIPGAISLPQSLFKFPFLQHRIQTGPKKTVPAGALPSIKRDPENGPARLKLEASETFWQSIIQQELPCSFSYIPAQQVSKETGDFKKFTSNTCRYVNDFPFCLFLFLLFRGFCSPRPYTKFREFVVLELFFFVFSMLPCCRGGGCVYSLPARSDITTRWTPLDEDTKG